MTAQSSTESDSVKQILQSEFNKTHHSKSKDEEVQSIFKQPSSESKNHGPDSKKEEPSQEATLQLQLPSVMEKTRTSSANIDGGQAQQAGAGEESGRDRLKRHRVEVAGQVWIPDMWGQEELLKDWIDCSAFDASLLSSNIMLARAALVQEGRRANSGRLRIENSC